MLVSVTVVHETKTFQVYAAMLLLIFLCVLKTNSLVICTLIDFGKTLV